MSRDERSPGFFSSVSGAFLSVAIRASVRSPWSGWALLAVIGVVMASWSWSAWTDLIIDFGRELYVPWRLSEGDVLYRDIAYFNGPLSPYLNALWFGLFGVGFRTLIVCNLFLLALFSVLLMQIIRQLSDQFTAFFAAFVFLGMFSFLQLVGVANYNFVAPYSHEATHGTMLAFLSLFFLWRCDRGPLWNLIASGVALGLVALTKVELFVALLIAEGAFLLMFALDRNMPWQRVLGGFALFCFAASIPSIFAVYALESIAPVSNLWGGVLNRELTAMSFYRRGMGLIQPVESLMAIIRWSVIYVAVFGPAIWIGMSKRLGTRSRLTFSIGWTSIVALVMILKISDVEWPLAFRPLPLVLLVALGVLLGKWCRQNIEIGHRRLIARAFSICLFAFVLLGKMIFAARIYQYGFVLAMPATMILVVIVLSWLPRYMQTRGGSGLPLKHTAATVILLIVGFHIAFSGSFLRRHEYQVGVGRDAFKTDSRAIAANEILNSIETHVAPSQTIAVVPEGVMLNYLARRSTSIPYISLMPLEMAMFGEENIRQSFRDHPPDFVAMVHRDTSPYGFHFFGADYGIATMDWIVRNYTVVEQAGAAPFQTNQFGIQLLVRKDLISR
jgi:hypothetical protein